MSKVKNLRIQCGVSENKCKGTWNGHISLLWPDKPSENFYYPGEPGKPFKSAQEANEWCNAEVVRLNEKIAHNQRRARLIV